MQGLALIVGAGGAGERSAAALRELGIGSTGPLSARDVANDPSPMHDPAVTAVHICSTNELHVPLALAALDAGKHVICEKPLATDAAGADLLDRRAREAGRLGVVAYTYRFHPLVVELVARVSGGATGAPHLVRGAFLQDWLLDAGARDWRLDASRGGASRVVADLGLHWLDLAEFATGCPVTAVAAQVGRLHGRDTEDHAALLVRFDGGLQGVCVLSQAATGHKNTFEITVDCAGGALSWRWERPDELELASRGSIEVITRDAVAAPAARAFASLVASSNEGRRNLIAAVYARIAGEDPTVSLPSFADGLRHARFVDAALRSAREQAWVEID